jgi:hypothetical protein
MSCKVCREPEAGKLRRAWGCEEEAPEDVWAIECVRCGGQNPTCERCGGTGRESGRRCPQFLLRGRHDIHEMLRLYAILSNHGLMPNPGGVLDQSPQFLAAVRIIDGELAELRKRKV